MVYLTLWPLCVEMGFMQTFFRLSDFSRIRRFQYYDERNNTRANKYFWLFMRDHSSFTSAKKLVGGVRKWHFLLIYSTIYPDTGECLGLKKPKTCWRNTWMVTKEFYNIGGEKKFPQDCLHKGPLTEAHFQDFYSRFKLLPKMMSS